MHLNSLFLYNLHIFFFFASASLLFYAFFGIASRPVKRIIVIVRKYVHKGKTRPKFDFFEHFANVLLSIYVYVKKERYIPMWTGFSAHKTTERQTIKRKPWVLSLTNRIKQPKKDIWETLCQDRRWEMETKGVQKKEGKERNH